MSANCYTGAYLSVVESLSRMVAAGFDHEDLYLTFQEYFERLRDVPSRWGKPTAALLGALMAQVDLGIASIGGKDSMSGSFEDLDVPPTLVSFATGLGHVDRVTSPEFKGAGHRVAVLVPDYADDASRPEPAALLATYRMMEGLIARGEALAVSTLGYGRRRGGRVQDVRGQPPGHRGRPVLWRGRALLPLLRQLPRGARR